MNLMVRERDKYDVAASEVMGGHLSLVDDVARALRLAAAGAYEDADRTIGKLGICRASLNEIRDHIMSKANDLRAHDRWTDKIRFTGEK